MTTRMIVLLVALCGSAVGGEQPANMGEAFAVSAPGPLQPQYFVRAAWSAGAKCWLVVWQDGVPTDDGTDGAGAAQNILAVRVSADGKVLDSKPVEVCAAKGSQLRPMVASDGKDFFVVWHDFRNKKDWDVYGARVTGEGKVLDQDGTALSSGEHNQCFPDVVWGGGNYYLAWLDMRHWPEYRIYGSRVLPEGKTLDGAGVELIRVMSDKEMEAWKKAPFAPGKKGRGWHNFGEKGMVGIKQPGSPSLGTDGKCIVLASEIQGENPGEIAVRVVDAAGGQPAGTMQLMQDKAGGGYTHWTRPAVAATGGGFLLASHFATGSWGSGPGTWVLARLGADGKAGAFGDIVTLGSQYPPGYRSYGNRQAVLGLAWDGKRGLFVCEHHRHSEASKNGPGTPGNIDVLALCVDAEGKRLGGETPIEIASGPATQSAPAAAAGPEGSFLVVWQEEEPGKDSRIMARVIRAQ